MALYLKAIGFWLGLAVLAVLVGGLREATLTSRVGELRAHQIGSLFMCFLVFILTMVFVRIARPTARQALFIGASWVLLTIGFESTMVLYLLGQSWDRLFSDYNVFRGRLWSLFLLTLFLGPYLATKWESSNQ